VARLRLLEASQITMLRSPLPPAVSQGVAAMPPSEGVTMMRQLIAAMISGDAICATGRLDGHPVEYFAQPSFWIGLENAASIT